MFGPEELRRRLQQQPYVPIRVATTAGRLFDIWHADRAWVGNRSFLLRVPKAAAADESAAEEWIEIAFDQVAAIGPAPQGR
jgi:hypothetical protein